MIINKVIFGSMCVCMGAILYSNRKQGWQDLKQFFEFNEVGRPKKFFFLNYLLSKWASVLFIRFFVELHGPGLFTR